jgi:hypothetical protein
VTRITVSADYEASPAEAWAVLEPVEHHVDWMADAESIRFQTDQTRGVGTRFECVTKIGPIRLTDVMEITEWEPERCMGVRHDGLVTGSGTFTLEPLDEGRRTRFTWSEELRFPWWLGGPIGAAIGSRLVMKRLWNGNLRRLRPLVERAP